ncbi:MAG: hypothetical protein V1824_02580, partial [archaeon]
VLERLKNKGLVSEIKINGIKNFSATPPKKLLNFINDKKENLEKEEKQIKEIIPQLESIQNTQLEETKIDIYKGIEGLKNVLSEILDTLGPKDEILTFGATIKKEKRITDLWKRWIPKRHKLKIPERVIFIEKSSYLDFIKKNTKYEKIKLLEMSTTPVTFNVWSKDRVIIYNYTFPYSFIVIRDKQIAESFRNYFEQLWKIAKPV